MQRRNVTSEDGLVIATRLTDNTTDTARYQDMTPAAAEAAAAMAAAGGPGDGRIGLARTRPSPHGLPAGQARAPRG